MFTSINIDIILWRDRSFLMLYSVYDIILTHTFFLFDLMHCSWLYPGVFKVSWFIWVGHVSHRLIHVNWTSRLSKQYVKSFNFFLRAAYIWRKNYILFLKTTFRFKIEWCIEILTLFLILSENVMGSGSMLSNNNNNNNTYLYSALFTLCSNALL